MKSVVDLGNNVYQELPATAIVTKFTSPYACILINHKWKSATAFWSEFIVEVNLENVNEFNGNVCFIYDPS